MPQQVKLNLGCGLGLLEGFTNVDAFYTEEQIREGAATKQGPCQAAVVEPGATYVQANILNMPFPDDYADYALLSEVIEHFAITDVFPALSEVRRVLKPGGVVTITAPDFNGICNQWLGTVASQVGTFKDWALYRFLAETAYGNQAGEGEFHRCPITPDFLNVQLLIAGFEGIEMTVYRAGYAPPLGYDGCRYSPDGKLRCDDILATARKPLAAPPALGIRVVESVGVGDALS
jgi:SAM-dependent methyltransferase